MNTNEVLDYLETEYSDHEAKDDARLDLMWAVTAMLRELIAIRKLLES